MGKRGPKPGSPSAHRCGARPKELTEEQWTMAAKLAEVYCTKTEIADFFDCSTDKLDTAIKARFNFDFNSFIQKNQSKGNAGLKQALYAIAATGKAPAVSIAYLINKLGFQDVKQITHKSQEENTTTIKTLELLSKIIDRIKPPNPNNKDITPNNDISNADFTPVISKALQDKTLSLSNTTHKDNNATIEDNNIVRPDNNIVQEVAQDEPKQDQK